MELEFLKGQLVAYNKAISIVSESRHNNDSRESLILEIMIILEKTGNFSKYLVEVIPEHIFTIVHQLRWKYENNDEGVEREGEEQGKISENKLLEYNLSYIVDYLCEKIKEKTKSTQQEQEQQQEH